LEPVLKPIKAGITSIYMGYETLTLQFLVVSVHYTTDGGCLCRWGIGGEFNMMKSFEAI
jgi:hypothetical protein